MKAYLKKLSKLLSISLSLAIILTVLPMNTVHVHAADETKTITFKLKATDFPNNDNSTKAWSGTIYDADGITITFNGQLYSRYSSPAMAKLMNGTLSITSADNWKITYANYVRGGAAGYLIYNNPKNPVTSVSVTNGTMGIYIHNNDTVDEITFNLTRHYCTNTELASQNGSPATCTADGYNDYWKCPVCGKIYAAKDVTGTAYNKLDDWKASADGKINKLGHDYTDAQWQTSDTLHWKECTRTNCPDKNGSKTQIDNHSVGTTGTAATCTSKAICGTCGAAFGDVAGHILVSKTGQAATCAQEGWNDYYECSTCGKVYTNAQGTGTEYADLAAWKASEEGKIAKLTGVNDHIFSTTWSFDETNHWHICERCNDVKADNAAHTGGTATCLQKAICETCGKTYGELGAHNLVKQNAQAANCTQEGWQEYWECSVCHEVYSNENGTGTKYTEIEWKDGAGKVEKNNNHDWSYAVNGNTITATCSRNEEEHTASISISANNAEYTGSAYALTDETAWTNSSLGLTVPTVKYIGRDTTTYNSTTAPTDAGKYTAQITLGEDADAVTASSNFEINKKEVELNWHNTTVTYNGTSQAPTATVTNKANTSDEVNVNVTFAGEHTNANANGESYTAIASSLSGTAAGNYKLPTTLPTHPFVIEPKAIGTTTIIASYTKTNPQTYTGNEFTQTISIVDGSNQLTLNSDYQLEGDIAKTMPGLYDTKVKGIGNYTGETTVEWEIVAAEIDNDDIHVTPYNAEYDGAYHSITVAPKKALAGATVTYSTTKDGTYTATNPSYKNAGEYTVYYKVEKTGHTTLNDFSTITISHKEVTIGWSDTELTYNGSAQKPTATVTNKVSGDVVNVTVTGAETKAGTYTAVASGLYGDNSENYVLNYKLPIVEPSTTFTIYKAKVDAPTADSTEFTYDGSEQTYTLATSELYTISHNTRTLAGTQIVTVELNDKDNYEWNGVTGSDDQKVADREYTFTINKATVTIPTEDSTTYTYTGQAQTYGLTETNDYTVSNSTHTNAGSYEVDVILKDHNNYMWSDNTTANKKFTFTINKQDVTKPTALETVFTYSGQPQTYNLPTSEFYTVSNNTHTNAGTYKVDVVLKDSIKNNYKWANETGELVEYDFIINKQSVNAPAAITTPFTYNRASQTYNLATNSLYSISNNHRTSAGSQTVTVSLNDKDNYKWSGVTGTNESNDKSYTFTINPLDISSLASITLDSNSFVYSGVQKSATVSRVTDGTVEISADTDYEYESASGTNVGTYNVAVSFKGNYTGSANKSWSITKADSSLSAPTAKTTLVYNGNNQELVNAGTATGGTLMYSLDGTNYSASLPVATNANTYTVYYKVVGDSNHNDIAPDTLEVTIAKANSSLTAPTAKTGLVYNGSYQELVNEGIANGGTLVYSLDNDDYSAYLPEGLDAGTYTVYYKVVGDTNHNDTTEGNLSVTISKANQTITSENITLTYGDIDKSLFATSDGAGTLTYSIKSGSSSNVVAVDETTGELTINNAGTTTIVASASETSNYNSASKEINVTVNKKVVDLLWSNTEFTYDGTSKAPTAQITNKVGQDDVSISVAGAKTDAGNNYTATTSLVGEKASNYALPENSSHLFNILRRPIEHADFTVTYNGSSEYPVYSGQEVTPSITVTYGGSTLTQGVDYTLSGDTSATDSDLYEIKVEGIGNFKDDTTINWEILGKPFEDNEVKITSYHGEYDGQNKQIKVEVLRQGTKVTYSTDPKEDRTYSESNPSFKEVGTHTVYFKVEESNSVTKYDSTTVIIEPRTVTLNWSNTSLTYLPNTAQKPTATVTNKVSDEVVNVEVIGEQTNAGTYTATAHSLSGTNAGNYRLSTHEPTKQFTINKVEVDVPVADTTTFTFNRSEQTYVLTPSNLYTISNNKQTDADTYTVTVSLKDKDNYVWKNVAGVDKTANREYEFIINPLDISDTATVALDHAYYEFTGIEKIAHVSKVTDGVVDLVEGKDFILYNNTATDPGTYYLYIEFINNYMGDTFKEWTIVEDVQHTQDVELPDDEGYVGKLELVVTGDDEVPDIKIDNPIDLLDESDKNLLKLGNEDDYHLIELIVSLNAYEEEHTHEDSLAAIKDLMGDQTGSHYYDISVRKVIKHIVNGQVVHTDIYPITNTEPDEIKITLGIPEEIPSLKAGYSRKYSMIRSHNYGTDANPDYKAEILDVEVKGGEISFSSDKFSDYVLAYKDTLIPRSYKAPNTSVR